MKPFPLSPHDVGVVVWSIQELRRDVDQLSRAVLILTGALRHVGTLPDDVAGSIQALATPPSEPYPGFSETGVRLMPADQVRQGVAADLQRLGEWAMRFTEAGDDE